MKLSVHSILTISKIILVLAVFFTIILLGRDLLPFLGDGLEFHDITQYARIEEYTSSIRAFQIPPSSAKNMNFGLGYPMFIFYAPIAYIVGSAFHITSISTIDSVKAAFLFFWLVGACGMYAFAKAKTKNHFAGILAAVFYAGSPWWASEIFVRGNLATSAFLAFAPWSLWSVYRYKSHPKLALLAIMLMMLSHNALSLIFVPILLAFSFLVNPNERKSRMQFVVLAILSSSWFWIPALLELSQTYANEVALLTKYSDHFLCIEQIWSVGYWGYGGSAIGCTDGMSFMLGKMQILIFLAGIVFAIWKAKSKPIIYFEILVVLWLVFMTLPDSIFIWTFLTPIHAIQFPWRLLAIALIFVISIGSHALEYVLRRADTLVTKYLKPILDPQSGAYILCAVIVFVVALSSSKFFAGKKVSRIELSQKYLSAEYISFSAAYRVPEYLPKTVNRDFWLLYQDQKIPNESKSILARQMSKFTPNMWYVLLGFAVSAISIYFALCRTHSKKTH